MAPDRDPPDQSASSHLPAGHQVRDLPPAGRQLPGAVLFAWLALSSPEAAPAFRGLIGQGSTALTNLPPGRIAAVQAEIAGAFRAGFLTIAAFAAIGVALAWSIPARRL